MPSLAAIEALSAVSVDLCHRMMTSAKASNAAEGCSEN